MTGMQRPRPVEYVVKMLVDPGEECEHHACVYYRVNRMIEESSSDNAAMMEESCIDYGDRYEAMQLIDKKPAELLDVLSASEEFQTDVPVKSGSCDGLMDVLAYLQMQVASDKRHMKAEIHLKKNCRVLHVRLQSRYAKSFVVLN